MDADENGALKGFVPIRDDQGNVVGMTDKAVLEHLASTAPMPTQATLDEMLKRATRVCIWEVVSASGQDPVRKDLLDLSGERKLRSLSSCLRLDDPPVCGHCMCCGSFFLEFFRRGEQLALIGLHHGVSIRWDAWKYDAALANCLDLLEWLSAHGVGGPMNEYQESMRRAEEEQNAASAWRAAMPACLKTLGDQVFDFTADLTPLKSTLLSTYPETDERIRVLFSWYGSGSGLYSGYPAYEDVPLQLLLEYATPDLVRVASMAGAEKVVRAGAQRLFRSWSFRKRRKKVPEDLR